MDFTENLEAISNPWNWLFLLPVLLISFALAVPIAHYLRSFGSGALAAFASLLGMVIPVAIVSYGRVGDPSLFLVSFFFEAPWLLLGLILLVSWASTLVLMRWYRHRWTRKERANLSVFE